MNPVVVTAGESMIRLMGAEATRLRHADSLTVGIAGAESNLAIGLSRLGHAVALITRLGDDELGELVLRRIAAERVDLRGVRRVHGASTGLLLREQAPEGQRVYYYRHGSAASGLSPDDVDPTLLAGARVLHLTGITPSLSASARAFCDALMVEARGQGLMVSLDVNFRSRLWPAEACRGWIEAALPAADLLFISREEGEALWGAVDQALLERLAAAGPRGVILKGDGADSLAWVEGQLHRAPLHAVSAVDPVGAGDAFAAGYLDGWLAGRPPEACLRQANAMGAICVTGRGDYEGLPERASLERFMAGSHELGR
ncbi:sugar kinase [Spiribacter halobius]|uniref:Sugar kinase n=1 Tax=Sediminicurvatus halobius TaxID=2182432 RepID=A0A2U2N5D1_9GAMM|nr:sugar kinase [Spiribacter halobius]PWG64386.1 sugar kinase [Spiribacter halobius]UEX79266.1 sugar kinase [Spiribacter halobius]